MAILTLPPHRNQYGHVFRITVEVEDPLATLMDRIRTKWEDAILPLAFQCCPNPIELEHESWPLQLEAGSPPVLVIECDNRSALARLRPAVSRQAVESALAAVLGQVVRVRFVLAKADEREAAS